MHRKTKLMGVILLLMLLALMGKATAEKRVTTEVNITIKKGYVLIKYTVNTTESMELEYKFNKSQVIYIYSEEAELKYNNDTGILIVKTPTGGCDFYVVLSNVHRLEDKVFKFEMNIPLLPVGLEGTVVLNVSSPVGTIENYTAEPPLNMTKHELGLITVIEAEKGMRLTLDLSIKPHESGWLYAEVLHRRIILEDYGKAFIIDELVLANQGPRSVGDLELYLPPNSTVDYVRGAVVIYPRDIRVYGYSVTRLNNTIKLYVKLISKIGKEEKGYLKLGYSTPIKNREGKLMIPAYYWPGIFVKKTILEIKVRGTIEEVPKEFKISSKGGWQIAKLPNAILTVENLGMYELQLAFTISSTLKPILYIPILVIALVAIALYVQRRRVGVKRVEKPSAEMLVLTEAMDNVSRKVMELVSTLNSVEDTIRGAKGRKIRRNVLRKNLREYSSRLNRDLSELRNYLKQITDLKADLKDIANDIDEALTIAKDDMLRALRLLIVRGAKVAFKDIEEYSSKARRNIERSLESLDRLKEVLG